VIRVIALGVLLAMLAGCASNPPKYSVYVLDTTKVERTFNNPAF
jgi:uncharacterized lipoprotein YmbA